MNLLIAYQRSSEVQEVAWSRKSMETCGDGKWTQTRKALWEELSIPNSDRVYSLVRSQYSTGRTGKRNLAILRPRRLAEA
jgi:hypothetical protein